jgi:hypothetical protein
MRARRVLDACIQRESNEPGSVIIPLRLVEDVAEVAQLPG